MPRSFQPPPPYTTAWMDALHPSPSSPGPARGKASERAYPPPRSHLGLTPYRGTGGSVPSMGSFTIGVLARSAGVSVETVRYYERRGLLEQPPSEPFGYRQYSEDDVRR